MSLKSHHFELLTVLIKTPNRTQHDFEDIIKDINEWRPRKLHIKSHHIVRWIYEINSIKKHMLKICTKGPFTLVRLQMERKSIYQFITRVKKKLVEPCDQIQLLNKSESLPPKNQIRILTIRDLCVLRSRPHQIEILELGWNIKQQPGTYCRIYPFHPTAIGGNGKDVNSRFLHEKSQIS